MKTSKSPNNIINILKDLLFPLKCLGCNKDGYFICPLCLEKIEKPKQELDKNIFSLFSYKNPVARKIIWELKYHYKYKLAEDLGQFLFDNSKEKLSLILKDSSTRPILIVPIPLSRKRRWRRGYNQSDYIARGFCSCVNSNLFLLEKRILFKNKNTSPQAKIKDREERLKNIQGVFFIKGKEKINGKTIIIIDDVVTTGGTIKEAMRVLKNNGAEKVYALTLAH